MESIIPNSVVIAGGTGFIGSHLITPLIEKRYNPVILGREPESSVKIPGVSLKDFRYAIWDGKNEGPWTQYLNGAKAVINLAGASIGEKKWTPERKKLIRDSRIDSTAIITRVINSSTNPPEVFVSGSAIGYYGNRGDESLDENSAPGDDFLAKLCVDWEAEADKASSKTRLVNIRTGIVQHASGGSLLEMLPLFKAYAGGPLGSGKQWFSWVHLADEIGIILWSIENANISGPINLTSPNPLKMENFAQILGKALHRPSWLKVPEFAIRAKLGEAADFILASQKVFPKKALDNGYKFKFPDAESALSEIAQNL